MTKTMRKAYTEVDEILKYMPNEYVKKVPSKFLELFHKARLEEYHVHIDPDKAIYEQNLIYETFVILTILKLNCWCDSEEEKNRIMKQIEENQKKNQDRYDISKLYQKNEKAVFTKEMMNDNTLQGSTNANQLPMIKEKASWLSKLWRKIRNLFKKG